MTDDERIAEFLAKGGQVRKVPPGPSDKVVYLGGGFRGRGKPQPPKPVAEQTPPPAQD